MGFQDVLGSVESEELKGKLLNAYTADLQAETDKGKSFYKKKDGELLALKNSIKDVGFSEESHGTLKGFVESLKTVTTDAKEQSAEFVLLKKQLDDMKGDLLKEKNTAKRSKLEAELTSAIGKKFKGAKLLINSLINDGAVDIDGKTVHFKNGDDVISFEDGVKGLEDTYKDLLIVEQNGGTGEDGGAGKGAKTGEPTFADMLKKEIAK